jgi:hypothetical protein
VAGWRCGRLIAVHLADEPEHGSRRELQKQHEREGAKPHDAPSIHTTFRMVFRLNLRARTMP